MASEKRMKITKVANNGLRYWSELTTKADYIAKYDNFGDYVEIYRERGFLVVKDKDNNVKVFRVLKLSYDYERNMGKIPLRLADKKQIQQLISDLEVDIRAQKMRVENYDFIWERGKPIEKVKEEVKAKIQRLNAIISILKSLI